MTTSYSATANKRIQLLQRLFSSAKAMIGLGQYKTRFILFESNPLILNERKLFSQAIRDEQHAEIGVDIEPTRHGGPDSIKSKRKTRLGASDKFFPFASSPSQPLPMSRVVESNACLQGESISGSQLQQACCCDREKRKRKSSGPKSPLGTTYLPSLVDT